MQMTELIDAARFVVDSDGRRKAVVLDYEHWQELLELLEETWPTCRRSTASATPARKRYRGSRPRRSYGRRVYRRQTCH